MDAPEFGLITTHWIGYNCNYPMLKKTLDARRTLAYGLEFRKFKRRLNVIKSLFYFIFIL